MIFIACDIGNPGALAALNSDGRIILVRELPIVCQGGVLWVSGVAFKKLVLETFADWPVRLTVELTQSIPVDTASRPLSAGAMLGSILATAQQIGNGVGTRVIKPDSWRARLGIDHSKASALDLARRLFPGGRAGISQGAENRGHAVQYRANALLIAESSRREYREEHDYIEKPRAPDLKLLQGGAA